MSASLVISKSFWNNQKILITIFIITIIGDLLHELSNDGAKKQFEDYLKYIMPALVQCARVS